MYRKMCLFCEFSLMSLDSFTHWCNNCIAVNTSIISNQFVSLFSQFTRFLGPSNYWSAFSHLRLDLSLIEFQSNGIIRIRDILFLGFCSACFWNSFHESFKWYSIIPLYRYTMICFIYSPIDHFYLFKIWPMFFTVRNKIPMYICI